MKVVEKLNKHVCVHSKYSYIKTFLERNNLWSAEMRKFLARILEELPRYLATAKPEGTRKVSLSAMSPQLNIVLCVDHMYLENNRVFDTMESTS